MLMQNPEGIVINNAIHITATIGKCSELGEILEDLSLAHYDIWGGMYSIGRRSICSYLSSGC